MQNKLFVRNLSFRTDSEDLNDLFSSIGKVVSAKLATDRDTGRSRGFGFVEMSDSGTAQHAIDSLNNTEFQGRTIAVSISQPTERRPQTAYAGRNW